ncbi:MAG: hypothetical protein L3J16_00960 [Anaerolineales bacterium]|nr:hypothetical protein [Anaerolineales bacterium]
MTNNPSQGPQGLLAGMAFGGIFFLTGSFVVLAAANIIPTDPSSFNAPRWVVGAIGGTFMFTGMMIAIQGAFGPDGQQTLLYQWLQLFIGLALMTLFSSVFLWIGFGPGVREFSSSSSFGPFTVSGAGNVDTGRLAFGSIGVFMVFFTIVMTVRGIRKIIDLR